MKRRLFGILLSFALMLGLVPGMGLTAYAADDPVYYMAWNDIEKKVEPVSSPCTDYRVVESSTEEVTWVGDASGSWFVVKSDGTISKRITVIGTVNLILCDGATLTASKGITVSNGNTLNIYGQSAGTGALTTNGVADYAAGIGGGKGEAGGTVSIHGGSVTATGGKSGAGIGGGGEGGGTGATVNIHGGTVNATGGELAAGIGGGYWASGGTVIINGGIVNATGGWQGAGIGSGNGASVGELSSGTVTINGGTVNATGGAFSAGIGGGCGVDGGIVTINGGIVSAIGDEKSMGIGKGYNGQSNGSLKVATTHAVYSNGSAITAANKYYSDNMAQGEGDKDMSIARKQYMLAEEGAVPEKYPLWVGGRQVNAKTAANITGGATATAIYDDSTKTLTLNGANITTGYVDGDYVYGIYYTANEPLIIESPSGSDNKIIGTEAFDTGIRAGDAEITLSGNGKLTAEGNFRGIDAKDITIDGTNVTAKGETAIGSATDVVITDGKVNAAGKYTGIYAKKGDITIKDGNVTATGQDGGIKSYVKDVIVVGGTIEASGTIGIAGENVTVNGGTVNATGMGAMAPYDPSGIYAEKTIEIKAGKVTATGDGYGMLALKLVKNHISGTGWSDKDGTADKTAIAINTEGQDLSTYKKVQFPALVEYPLWVGEVQVTETNKDDPGERGWSYTPAEGTTPAKLTLDNYSYSSSSGAHAKCAIFAGEKLTIELVGTNNVDITEGNEDSYAVYGDDDLTIQGSGTLNAKGNISGIFGGEKGDITINGGRVEARSVDGNAIDSFNNVIIEDSIVEAHATGSGYGIISLNYDSGSVKINGGSSVTASGGGGAIAGKVKNSIAGTGWTNKEGSGEGETIAKNTGEEGQDLISYKKVQFPAIFTVTFVDGQGKTLKTEKVANGKAATAPADPTRDGYIFKGWDKDFSKVTEDMTVTALWEKKSGPAPTPEPAPTPGPAPSGESASAPESAVVLINTNTVNANTLYAAATQSGGGFNSATVVVLGSNVKKISKGSFKNFRNVKTLVVQSKKLKKSSVKKALKGSAVKNVKVQVGKKKTNKKYVKKYKGIFTKKNCGKKVSVTR